MPKGHCREWPTSEMSNRKLKSAWFWEFWNSNVVQPETCLRLVRWPSGVIKIIFKNYIRPPEVLEWPIWLKLRFLFHAAWVMHVGGDMSFGPVKHLSVDQQCESGPKAPICTVWFVIFDNYQIRIESQWIIIALACTCRHVIKYFTWISVMKAQLWGPKQPRRPRDPNKVWHAIKSL